MTVSSGELKYEKDTAAAASITDAGGEKPTEIKQSSIDVKLGQLEVSVGNLKEKIDGSLELRKWFIIALVAIFGTIVAIIFGASNLINNNLNSHREIQKDYYQLLIQNKNDTTSLIINLEKKNACLQKDSYWEFKKCSSALPVGTQ